MVPATSRTLPPTPFRPILSALLARRGGRCLPAPLADGSVSNIVLFDVLHHIEFPVLFLDEASRALRPGGRVIFSEPAITPVSNIFYISAPRTGRNERGHLHLRYARPRPRSLRCQPGHSEPDDASPAGPLRGPLPRACDCRVPPDQSTRLSDDGRVSSWTLIPGALVPPVLGLERILPAGSGTVNGVPYPQRHRAQGLNLPIPMPLNDPRKKR